MRRRQSDKNWRRLIIRRGRADAKSSSVDVLLAEVTSAILAVEIRPGLARIALSIGRIVIVAVGPRCRRRSDRRSAVHCPSRVATRNTCTTHRRQRTADARLRALEGNRNAPLLRPAQRQQCRRCECRCCNGNRFQIHLHGAFSDTLALHQFGPGRSVSKSLPVRTCWQHGARAFLCRHRSPCAYRLRMRGGP